MRAYGIYITQPYMATLAMCVAQVDASDGTLAVETLIGMGADVNRKVVLQCVVQNLLGLLSFIS
jgi:hypothetical protein